MIISFQPMGRSERAEEGENLYSVAEKAGIEINADCGGQGTCGKCKIKILEGSVNEPTDDEIDLLSQDELDNGVRLACRTIPKGPVVLEILWAMGHTKRKKDMACLPHDFVSDAKLGKGQKGYGLAVDIGTTTVVGMLWDMWDASPVGAKAGANPQSDFGSDVISRIMFCGESPGNLEKMQGKIISRINAIIDDFENEEGISRESIIKIVAVGNTTMSHLVLAKDPTSLAVAPFAPNFTGSVTLKAKSMGIKVNDEVDFSILPNIAGHVGSDVVGVMLASELDLLEGNSLAIDIGTNGEILLSGKGRTLACSTAAGPAFEGACITQGMRASTGAIENVQIEGSEVIIKVIGDVTPVGLCGSGLIDAVSELLKAGIVTNKGKLLKKDEALDKGIAGPLAQRLEEGPFGNAFILYTDDSNKQVYITQKDIREVQLAKGAIRAGVEIMLKELGITEHELDRIFLAGAFGNYINKESALTIGLLPAIDKEKIISIGNAAGAGASMALLSEEIKNKADSLADQVEHIELAEHEDFQNAYLMAMYF